MLFDTEIPGFILEVRQRCMTFGLKWKDPSGRTKYLKIGRYGDVTADQARQKAREIRAEISLGDDPHGRRQKLKSEQTVAQFAESEFLPHQRARKKSFKEDERICQTRIFPSLGNKRLSEVTTTDVTKFHDAILLEGRKPATANRNLATLKRLFKIAHDRELVPRNPAKAVRLFRENNQTERYLTDPEIKKLIAAIKTETDAIAGLAVGFLLATGARRGETLSAKWSDFQLGSDPAIWTIPKPKSGKRAQKPLNSAALSILRQLAALRQNEYVFPGSKPETFRKSIDAAFRRMCKAAGLGKARIHDLRHTYASLLVRQGVSLFVVQKLLNHSTPTMTQRYAHLAPSDLVSASERATTIMLEAEAGV